MHSVVIVIGAGSSGLTATSLLAERGVGVAGWAFTQDDLPNENRFPKIKQAVMTPIPDIYQAGQ